MSTALKCTLDVLRSVQLRVLVQVLALVFFDRDTIFEDTLVQSKEESRPSITAPNKPAISSRAFTFIILRQTSFLAAALFAAATPPGPLRPNRANPSHRLFPS